MCLYVYDIISPSLFSCFNNIVTFKLLESGVDDNVCRSLPSSEDIMHNTELLGSRMAKMLNVV